MCVCVKDPFARRGSIHRNYRAVHGKGGISDVDCHSSSSWPESSVRGYIADNDSLSVVTSGARCRALGCDNATTSRNLIKDRHIIFLLAPLTTSLHSFFYYLSRVSAWTTRRKCRRQRLPLSLSLHLGLHHLTRGFKLRTRAPLISLAALSSLYAAITARGSPRFNDEKMPGYH